MKKKKRITRISAEILSTEAMQSQTDWKKVKSAKKVPPGKAEDITWDWRKAKLVVPKAKTSVHLRVEPEVLAFFKRQGKGHIARMQAVLRSFAQAHHGR